MRTTDKKGQGATEYLLMLAAVLVIVAAAIYYVTRAGGFPAISATPASDDNDIVIEVTTGSIAAGDWDYSISRTKGEYDWTAGAEKLDAPRVTIREDMDSDNYYVSLRHGPTGHIYFSDRKLTIE